MFESPRARKAKPLLRRGFRSVGARCSGWRSAVGTILGSHFHRSDAVVGEARPFALKGLRTRGGIYLLTFVTLGGGFSSRRRAGTTVNPPAYRLAHSPTMLISSTYLSPGGELDRHRECDRVGWGAVLVELPFQGITDLLTGLLRLAI